MVQSRKKSSSIFEKKYIRRRSGSLLINRKVDDRDKRGLSATRKRRNYWKSATLSKEEKPMKEKPAWIWNVLLLIALVLAAIVGWHVGKHLGEGKERAFTLRDPNAVHHELENKETPTRESGSPERLSHGFRVEAQGR